MAIIIILAIGTNIVIVTMLDIKTNIHGYYVCFDY